MASFAVPDHLSPDGRIIRPSIFTLTLPTQGIVVNEVLHKLPKTCAAVITVAIKLPKPCTDVIT